MLGFGGRVQPVQQRQCRAGPVLGEQYPRQDQMFPLTLKCRLVAVMKAARFRPAGGSSDIALGQHQPCPVRRDWVETITHGRARGYPIGLAHRFQGARLVASGLPDPCQSGQARR